MTMTAEPTIQDVLDELASMRNGMQTMRDEMRAMENGLRGDMQAMEDRMAIQISAVEKRLNARIDSVRDELKDEIAGTFQIHEERVARLKTTE